MCLVLAVCLDFSVLLCFWETIAVKKPIGPVAIKQPMRDWLKPLAMKVGLQLLEWILEEKYACSIILFYDLEMPTLCLIIHRSCFQNLIQEIVNISDERFFFIDILP